MRDTITAISFDTAVMTFGVWVENKLNETTSTGRQRYTLRELLDPDNEEIKGQRNTTQAQGLRSLIGG